MAHLPDMLSNLALPPRLRSTNIWQEYAQCFNNNGGCLFTYENRYETEILDPAIAQPGTFTSKY